MKESFNDLTVQELLRKSEDMKKEFRDLRFNVVMGHVDNPLRKRILKRAIARISTIIHEHELGIRSDKE